MSKWILAKDKLPENRVGKIVYCEDESITMMYYDPEKKYWVSQMGFDRYDVLAWMEKPKPPRGLTPLDGLTSEQKMVNSLNENVSALKVAGKFAASNANR